MTEGGGVLDRRGGGQRREFGDLGTDPDAFVATARRG